MFKKRAQGLSITTIIIAIIGLLVLVVIITILTGKLGVFSKGVESASSCENTCQAIGWEKATVFNIVACKDTTTEKRRVIPGKFSDIPESTGVSEYGCCCRRDN